MYSNCEGSSTLTNRKKTTCSAEKRNTELIEGY